MSAPGDERAQERSSLSGRTLGAQGAQGPDFLDDQRLRPLERLLKRAQFLHAQRKGRRYTTSSLVIYACPNGLEYSRLGLTTSRKVGRAPARNRWRRLLREAFRTQKLALPRGFDLVVIVKPDPPSPELASVRRELLHGAHKAAQAASST